MPDNGKDNLNSDSEHDSQMDVDVLPTIEPQTPGQIPYKNSYPFPFYAFTPHALPYGFTQTPGTPSNTPHQMPVPYPTTGPSPFPISVENLVRNQEKATRTYRTVREKLDKVLSLLQEINWTMGELLYHAFRIEDENKQKAFDHMLFSKYSASAWSSKFCENWGKPGEAHQTLASSTRLGSYGV